MEQMEHLKIEYIALGALTPYENNAREHTAEDLATIEASIEKFGMCDPIGIWGENNIIVEGHGRLLALKALGKTEAPCIRLDHLTDDQRRAYALAHNKTAENSKWDFDKLEEELAELSLDFDMAAFGFYEMEAVADDDEVPQREAPQEFDEYDEDIETEHKCPKCGYEW